MVWGIVGNIVMFATSTFYPKPLIYSAYPTSVQPANHTFFYR